MYALYIYNAIYAYIYIMYVHIMSLYACTNIVNLPEKLQLVFLQVPFDCTQRNISKILLNETEIRLYLPFPDWFGTKNQFQINRCMVNTIWFRFDLIRFLCVNPAPSPKQLHFSGLMEYLLIIYRVLQNYIDIG